MKRILTILTLALTLVVAGAFKNEAAAQPGVGVDVSYQNFYDELSPYGQWIDYPDQGYVWVPNEGADFRPYDTNGHWVWSDEYEWMWVSDYSWGWAPFHYGRWLEDPSYGWMWVPGYEWAPAWVAWRDGGDYYGWAPLRPGINIGIGFSFGNYNPPINDWCFAPRRYIASPRIYDYCLPRRQNITIINNTTIINNYSRRTNNIFVTGPRRGDAERYAGRIRSVRFRESGTPGRPSSRRNEVSFYRPNIQRDNNRNAAPRNFEQYNRSGRDNRDALHRNSNAGQDNRDALHRNNNGQAGDRNVLRNNDNRSSNDNGIANRRPDTRDRRGNDDGATGNRNIPDRNNTTSPANTNAPRTRETRSGDNRTRNVSDRNNNTPARRAAERPANTERRNVFDRSNSQPANNPAGNTRPAERARPQNNQRIERRNDAPRQQQQVQRQQQQMPRQQQQTQRPQQQMPRQQQVQRQPQMQRQPSQAPRQFENRGGGDRRGSGRRN